MKFFIYYLILINALAFLLMLSDKHRAKRKLWRIPERVLFASAIAGGSVGAICGMYLVRHKTKHLSFTVGMPLILALQILLFVFLAGKIG